MHWGQGEIYVWKDFELWDSFNSSMNYDMNTKSFL